MSLAVVTSIHDWMDAGYPDPGEERREWARAAFDASVRGALGMTDPARVQAARQRKRAPISGSSYKHCPRQLFYKAKGMPQRQPHADARLNFEIGYLHEAAVVHKAIMCGSPVIGPGLDGEQWEGHIDFEGERIPFHPDLVLVEGAEMHMPYADLVEYAKQPGVKLYPIDIKSMNPYTLDDWKHGPRIKGTRGRDASKAGPENGYGYLSQVNVSMMHPKMMDRAGFICSSKLKGELRQFEVEADEMLQEEIRCAWRAALQDKIPAKPAWAKPFIRPQLRKSELQTKCGYCPFNTTVCWPDHKEETVSGRKVFRGPIPEESEE